VTEGGGKSGGTKKPWGGRYAADPAELFERLHASIPFDHVLAPFDIQGSRAHVRMLARIGVLAEEERDQILEVGTGRRGHPYGDRAAADRDRRPCRG
jgi:ribulose 1,5-bisphosphate carboxylase large subunit-like protein